MDKVFLRSLQIPLLMLDLFLLNGLFLVTQHAIPDPVQAQWLSPRSQYWLLLNVSWAFASWLGQLYSYQHLLVFRRFLQVTCRLYLAWAFFVLVTAFLLRTTLPLAREFMYFTILSFALALLGARGFYLLLRVWVRTTGTMKRRVLILGYNKVAEKLAAYLEAEEFNVRVECIVDDVRPAAAPANHVVVPGLGEALSLARELRVTEIYSTIMPENNALVYDMMQQADQDLIRFRFVPDFATFINRPVHVDYLYELPILSIRKEPLQQVANKFAKRLFDVVISLGATLFILSWLVPLLGVLIKLESPGPILFRQLRSGLHNQPFYCLKFRSMAVNHESNTRQATRQDARVTRLGRFLRKTSLDEFPQFLNVLLGQMSIVGPRPHMLRHTLEYSSVEDQYMIRQFLKPGITGWAQVNGYRGEISTLRHIQKRVEYDLWYLENWRLSLDVKIMFRTAYNVFRGEENAY
ncbi:undecaprenyl-phosphate glucose phosphotransferase [Hymenobacter sp. BT188]|uniref:undecaprenyl-phosphate glucose phosphotransferase n=1 Tax=Hymenobacter sp. BT188 TaxID=2763504 RepID=UPI00165189F3|nr:undecaprenyl-phosphate glucose phosphotransferase [Hymenobacter sp. BT188]MBC6608758.1 undecaprenyl-phosphate glucose phosphotransferase [Hymenobacter sp. BT188]